MEAVSWDALPFLDVTCVAVTFPHGALRNTSAGVSAGYKKICCPFD
jgi:hypothetical protein